jgi:hypothetical protein
MPIVASEGDYLAEKQPINYLFISLKLTYESLIIYHLFVAILYDNGVI